MPKYNAIDMVGDLLNLIDQKWVEPSLIFEVLDKFDSNDITKKIGFLREFKMMFRLIPETVFESEAQRDNIFEVIQICQDKLIEDEENEIVKLG